MSKNDFINLIHRYLTGECTPEEIERVEQWIEADPENRKTFEGIKKIWRVKPEKELRGDLGDAWHRLEEKMKEKDRSRPDPMDGRHRLHDLRKQNQRHVWLRAAAILVIGLLLSVFAIRFIGGGLPPGFDSAEHEEMAMQEVRTDRAHQSRLTFSDGTEVRLNAASLIRFPRQFNSNIREVWLEGEAWFDVQHNPDVEFVVQTPDAVVRVLGTEFNVKAYTEEPNIEVVVAEGRVSVQAADGPGSESSASGEVLLEKGEMSRVVRGEGPTPARKVDIENYLSWLNGRFIFDETPFARVIAEWERRFDVDIDVQTDDSLTKTPFTGEFRYESLDEMLRLTSLTLEFEYTRENNTIKIFRNKP